MVATEPGMEVVTKDPETEVVTSEPGTDVVMGEPATADESRLVTSEPDSEVVTSDPEIDVVTINTGVELADDSPESVVSVERGDSPLELLVSTSSVDWERVETEVASAACVIHELSVVLVA